MIGERVPLPEGRYLLTTSWWCALTGQIGIQRWTRHDDRRFTSPDAAAWHPTDDSAELSFGRGRAPRMTHQSWQRSQTTELGANATGWYRRCLTPGCRVWAGPYRDALEAKQDGMDHQHLAHDLPETHARRSS